MILGLRYFTPSFPKFLRFSLPPEKIDGIFFDLGVSSPQLENSSRGFSFKCDGPLDMRMNQEKGRTAEDWINSAPEKEIADVLWRFGEERFSRKLLKK